MFGSVCVILKTLNSRSIVGSLEQIESAYTINEDALPNSIIVEVTSYLPTNPTNSDYTIISSANYSEDIIEQIVEKALNNAHLNNGNYKDFHFKLVKNINQYQIFQTLQFQDLKP